MCFSMAPPGPKISAMVGFLISGWLSRDGARSGCGDTAARGCPFSLARFGIGRRVRAIFPEKPRNTKIAHRECHSHLHPKAQAWVATPTPPLCHSERSEESLRGGLFPRVNRREVLRFAQNDNVLMAS